MIDCMKVEVLDLSDLYLTRKEFAKTARIMKGMGYLAAIALILLSVKGIEQDARIYYLEQKLEKKETAG